MWRPGIGRASSTSLKLCDVTDNPGFGELDQPMVLNLPEIPFWDRIPADHPYHRLGFLHRINESGNAVLSADNVGTLFIAPTDIERWSREQAVNIKALDELGDDSIDQMFAPYHQAREQFYRPSSCWAPYSEQQQGAQQNDGATDDAGRPKNGDAPGMS